MECNAALKVIEVSTRVNRNYRTCGNIIYLPDYSDCSSRTNRIHRNNVKNHAGIIFAKETKKYLSPGMLQLFPVLMAMAYLTGSCLSALI